MSEGDKVNLIADLEEIDGSLHAICDYRRGRSFGAAKSMLLNISPSRASYTNFYKAK